MSPSWLQCVEPGGPYAAPVPVVMCAHRRRAPVLAGGRGLLVSSLLFHTSRARSIAVRQDAGTGVWHHAMTVRVLTGGIAVPEVSGRLGPGLLKPREAEHERSDHAV